jgi:hypothetical protein
VNIIERLRFNAARKSKLDADKASLNEAADVIDDMLAALDAADEALLWYGAQNFEVGGRKVGEQVAAAIFKVSLIRECEGCGFTAPVKRVLSEGVEAFTCAECRRAA